MTSGRLFNFGPIRVGTYYFPNFQRTFGTQLTLLLLHAGLRVQIFLFFAGGGGGGGG